MEEKPADPPPSKDASSQAQHGAGRHDAAIKRRGRPRLATYGGDPAQDRRAQMRRAQQTFRLKKEGLTRSLQARVDELEAEAHRRAECFSTFYNTAIRSNLHRTEPELAALLEDTATQLLSEKTKERVRERSKNTPEKAGPDRIQIPDERMSTSTDAISPAYQDTMIFGYQFSNQGNGGTAANARVQGNSRLRPSRSDHGHAGSRSYRTSLHYDSPVSCQGPLQEIQLKTNYTYSFQETSFSRRLHRYCLEHAYRLFIHPSTDPRTVYRVFRLVSCIADKRKMRPYFENLLRRGSGESLEILTLPFYTIGRAGMHYPRKDSSGKLTFPVNTRLPKRILGSLPLSVTGGLDQEQRYQEFLEVMGYGGVWLDSYDVEAYLKERGIIVDNLLSFVEVQPATWRSHLNSSPLAPATTSQYQASGIANRTPTPTAMQETAPYNSTGGIEDQINTIDSNPSSFFFDVQRFLEYLLRDVVMLGRAPGFRKSEVDAAIHYAMRTRPS